MEPNTIMSDNLMPVRAVNENQIVSTNGDSLPESVSQPKISMPRQISILNMINQWQPMGFRVILNLPFISDDQNFIFAIRNGPFIPIRPVHGHYDINASGPAGIFPNPIYSYSYNNMVPVVLPSDNGAAYPDPAKPTITLTNYDLPPPISTFAQSFRRWRGDMQYRLRMIAGFATQGYVIGTSIKNVFSPIGVYNQFKNRPAIERQDISFRPAMMNAYALSDTSMYRHLELTMPYDYPTTYFDQYAWISRRCTPGYLFRPPTTAGGLVTQSRTLIQTEPHGDNWIVIGIRGDLNSTQAGSQIIFELEYRCAEGFQFADPFLPPSLTSLPLSSIPANRRVYRVPDDKFTSDGLGMYTAVVGSTTTTTQPTTTTTRAPLIGIGIQSQQDQQRNQRGVNINISGSNANLGIQGNEQRYQNQPSQPIIDVPVQGKQRKRKGRDIPQDLQSEEETSNIETVDTSGLSALERLKLASGIPGTFSLGTSSRSE
nr:putative capsid protein [Lasius niger virus 1]